MTDTFSKEDVDILKDEEQTIYEEESYEVTTSVPQEDSSQSKHFSFFPFLLIGVGVYFLLRNFGYALGPLHWSYLFELWPFILIFIGVNTLLENWRTGIGRLVNLGWFLCGLAFFGYAVYFGNINGLLSTVGFTPPTVQSFSVVQELPQDAEVVSFDLNLDSYETELYALEDSSLLLDGTVYATDGVDVQLDEDGNGRYTLSLDTENNFFGNIGTANEETIWRLGLHPNLLYDLNVDMGSGVTNLDLSRFQLQDITLDGGSGMSQVTLPNGDYEAKVDVGSGQTTLTLGQARQVEIEGGSGALRLIIPRGIDVRLHVEGGSGSFSANDHPTLERISRDDEDSIWQTSPDYDMEIFLDVGSGSVTVE